MIAPALPNVEGVYGLLLPKGETAIPYFDRIKYLIVKNTNTNAIKTPTASAIKNNTVDGVLPMKEKSSDTLESFDAVLAATCDVDPWVELACTSNDRNGAVVV